MTFTRTTHRKLRRTWKVQKMNKFDDIPRDVNDIWRLREYDIWDTMLPKLNKTNKHIVILSLWNSQKKTHWEIPF